MEAVIQQLGLDNTFFIEFAIFAALFFILAQVYFKPFMKLFEIRHQRTVEDRQAAERLMAQAEARFEEYKKRLTEERTLAKKEFDLVIAEAKKEEAGLLAKARDQAKLISQEAADSAAQQRDQIRRQLGADVETLARTISEKLLARKV